MRIDDKIDALIEEINVLTQTQTRLVTLLDEAVVKKDVFYKEIGSVRAENRVLVGVLVIIGGALGTWVKLIT